MTKVHLLIGNEEIETDRYTSVRDPGRLREIVGSTAEGTAQHVDMAIRVANDAFQSWRKTTLDERIHRLQKAAQIIEESADEITTLIAKETGLTLLQSKGEIKGALSIIEDTMNAAESFFEPEQFEDDHSWLKIEKNPLGVIVGIVPWNAPVILTMQKLIPCLVTGNTIVVKPAPTGALGISTLLKKIALIFPAGVINVVLGDGEVGSQLVSHPLVRKISFTGGSTVARSIMKGTAQSLKQIHFELGGNDPAIVLDDAHLDTIMPKLTKGVFHRAGQFCFAIKRLYVPEQKVDEFFELFCQKVDEHQVGYQLDENVTMGPLNNEKQYHYVIELIEKAKKNGAEVVEVGTSVNPKEWNQGYYIKPTVVRNLDSNHELVTCEQFGPVIPIIPYRDEREVIDMANDSEYGLGSSIWSSDRERAVHVAQQIESGMTFINQNGQSRLGLRHMPFGGVKQSGMGRENSEIGLAEYIDYHAIQFTE